MAGLTTAGLDIKDLQTIIDAFVAEQLANIDPELYAEADDVLGQLNAIYGAALFDLWQLFELVYHSSFPSTATGTALSNLSEITGTIRREATPSTVLVHLEGTVSTVVPAGTEGYVETDPTSRYVTTADATIAEEGATDFVEVTMEAVTPGTRAAAFTADVSLTIASPVTGLDAITIQADHVPGTDEETDAELRIRREDELARPGSASAEAIRADILQDTDAQSCVVFENYTDQVDANGLPPKSIEVLVWKAGGLDAAEKQTLVDEIWESKPAGTETFGTAFGTVLDSGGNSQTVFYSEATEIRTYIEAEVRLEVETDVTFADLKEELAAFGDTLRPGDDVLQSDIIRILKANSGVSDVNITTTSPQADDETPTVGTSLVITGRQIATIDTADITIVSY